MKNKPGAGSGCGLIIIGVLVIAVFMWAITILLYILGAAIILGGAYLSLSLFNQSKYSTSRIKKQEELELEVTKMSKDASNDISDMLMKWETLMTTKGIGTSHEKDMFQNDSETLEEVYQQLLSAKEILGIAESSDAKIDAIIRAQKALKVARKGLK